MKKFLLSVLTFCILFPCLYAHELPIIWHRPDSLIAMPREDSISWTDEYTIFTVVRSMYADSTECLWSFTENDTIIYAVLTQGVYIPAGILLSGSPRDFSRWCVYAYHSGIRLDSTKTHTFRLGEQLVSHQDSAGVVADTLHARVAMEELAYFSGRVPRHVAETFQTHLALKYGITLDYAPYLSQTDDTLWHPKQDKDYYHHIIGIGNDTVYGWAETQSNSKENAILHIQTDSLAPNEYLLLGDDNGDLEWRLDYDGFFVLHREWRMRQFVKHPHRTRLSLRLSELNEPADSIRLAVIDANGYNSHLVSPDSIVGDSLGWFTLCEIDTLFHLRFYGIVTNPMHRNRKQSNIHTSSETDIHFDIEHNTLVIDGYPDGQVFVLYLYDATGKYVSSLSSMSPVDVSMLPSCVFYVEITANNQMVGGIPIPANIYK